MKKFFKKFLIWLSIILGLIVILGFVLFLTFKSHMEVKEGRVEIFQGATPRQVADLLEIEGIVKNSDFMYYYIKIKNKYYTHYNKPEDDWYPLRFQSGVFEIKKGDIDDVIVQINNIDNVIDESIKISIPEGKTIESMALIFEEKGLFKAEEFLEAVNNVDDYNQYKFLYNWLPEINKNKKYLLEGYLQANTYKFEKYSTPQMVINEMLKQMNNWYLEFTTYKSKLTFDQALTLASIVEAEAKFEADKPKVAQVFLNRIAKGMPLQSDMTAAYANGEHKVFMYNKDIQVNSPYNTYKVKGLPIGPINSTSLVSLKAVVNPAGPKFNMYFFYARPNGETFYTKTLKEHEKVIKKYEQEWKELEKTSQ